jgi:hypothetical protein
LQRSTRIIGYIKSSGIIRFISAVRGHVSENWKKKWRQNSQNVEEKKGRNDRAGQNGQIVNLAPNEINCQFANRISQNDYRLFECRNTVGTFAHKAVCQAYCARCKNRVAIYMDREAVIEKKPVVHQTTVEEWLGGTG